MKRNGYRHGEILFLEVKSIPNKDGLVKSRRKTFLVGSHGNPHKYDNGILYLKELLSEIDAVFGYFEAKSTTLTHIEHGEKGVTKLREARLPDGIYELRRQQEIVNEEMKPIID